MEILQVLMVRVDHDKVRRTFQVDRPLAERCNDSEQLNIPSGSCHLALSGISPSPCLCAFRNLLARDAFASAPNALIGIIILEFTIIDFLKCDFILGV